MTDRDSYLAGFAQAKEMADKIADFVADKYDPAETNYQDGYQNAALTIRDMIRSLTPPAPEPLSKKSF